MIASPASFHGTLADFFHRYVVPNLPHPETVAYYHRLIIDYCRAEQPLYVIRKVADTERGTIYETRNGNRFKASDNSPAWWIHAMLLSDIRLPQDKFVQAIATMPTHIFEVKQHVKMTISDFGWHVAHIYSAKDGDTHYRAWDRENLSRRFIRNIHPCNCFYIAKTKWQLYGGDPRVIAYFASQYASRYGDVWTEFCSLIEGLSLANGEEFGSLPYIYGEPQPSQPTIKHLDLLMLSPQVTYTSSRLRFKASVIEPLRPSNSFRVVTPAGTFQMTKADFHRDFDNVTASSSYRDKGDYNYKDIPAKALKYLVSG